MTTALDVRRRADLLDVREVRALPINDFEMRADGDTVKFAGYASVFDKKYEMYGGAEHGGWDEHVNRQAFDVTLREKPDLHLLINHEGMPLARTKSGTLTLSTDKVGLRAEAPSLDLRDPDVQRLWVKYDRGDMDEMSFAFRVKKQVWDDEYSDRELLEISLHKGDVSVVNFGANPHTSFQMNSLSALLEGFDELSIDDALAELRSQRGAPMLAEVARVQGILGRMLREARSSNEKRTLTVAQAIGVAEGLKTLDA